MNTSKRGRSARVPRTKSGHYNADCKINPGKLAVYRLLWILLLKFVCKKRPNSDLCINCTDLCFAEFRRTPLNCNCTLINWTDKQLLLFLLIVAPICLQVYAVNTDCAFLLFLLCLLRKCITTKYQCIRFFFKQRIIGIIIYVGNMKYTCHMKMKRTKSRGINVNTILYSSTAMAVLYTVRPTGFPYCKHILPVPSYSDFVVTILLHLFAAHC